MKKILSLLLIAVLCLGVLASCGGKDEKTTKSDETTKPATTTGPKVTTKGPGESTTTPGTGSNTNTEESSNKPGTGSNEPDEFDTEGAMELKFQYLDEEKKIGLTSRRNRYIEVCFILDGLEYSDIGNGLFQLWTWVVDVIDEDGNLTRMTLDGLYDVNSITYNVGTPDEYYKLHFATQEIGEFTPVVGKTYTVNIYAFEDETFSSCLYYGSKEIVAQIGEKDGEIITEPPYIPAELYDSSSPFENHHPNLPHEGRVVLVLVIEPEDLSLFDPARVLDSFDIYMYVDGQKYKITEISGWSVSGTKQGLRFGVEKAGFVPEEKGKYYKIRFEITAKDEPELIIFEIEEMNIKSNYPIGITPDENRKEDMSKKYDESKINVTGGPQGFNANEDVQFAFDGDIMTKWATGDVQTEPLTFTTEDAINVASISFCTANDNTKYGRTPAGIKVEASADNTTWDVLLDVTGLDFNEISELDNWKEYNFECTQNNTAYKFFRITFEGGACQFSEIWVFQQ